MKNNDLCEYLKSRNDLVYFAPVSKEQILLVEKQMNLSFAEDYKSYLMNFGCASFGMHEFTGICSSERLNVVNVTEFQKRNLNIPDGYYVIEEVHLDGIVLLQNCSGNVYSISPKSELTHISNSILGYIEKNSG